jgi:hypothetical protein
LRRRSQSKHLIAAIDGEDDLRPARGRSSAFPDAAGLPSTMLNAR